MHERIKSLRLALGLNQTVFGARLGVRQTTVAGWETGLRVPSDAVIISICREFGVSPEWLKLGVGEMFAPRSREEELAAFFGELSRDPDGSVRKRFIAALAKLPLESWDAIDAFCRDVYGIAPPGAGSAPAEGESSESRPAEAPPDIDHA
jgi:transcriptional regulator with XRE-family HTH domain|nr:MAG TPA: Repressor protein CI [Caudoviricetes sp.]